VAKAMWRCTLHQSPWLVAVKEGGGAVERRAVVGPQDGHRERSKGSRGSREGGEATGQSQTRAWAREARALHPRETGGRCAPPGRKEAPLMKQIEQRSPV
jgi:hypothetical protein